jgi:hypothetical protein
VEKHADAVKLNIVSAAVLAASADAVLVAHHLQKTCARLVTARFVAEVARRQELRGRKKAGVGGGKDAAAAGDMQLDSSSAGKMKYGFMCAMAS